MKSSSGLNPAPSGKVTSLPELALTVVVGVIAFGLVASQTLSSPQTGEGNLSMLNERVEMLSGITDPIKRDSLCVPLSAYGRALDKALDKDARVFFSGLVGTNNSGKGGYYYFLQNYLFPREVVWSLGTNAVFHCEYFEGTDCDSPAVLRTNGFDLMIRVGDSGVQLIPLTEKGVPHE